MTEPRRLRLTISAVPVDAPADDTDGSDDADSRLDAHVAEATWTIGSWTRTERLTGKAVEALMGLADAFDSQVGRAAKRKPDQIGDALAIIALGGGPERQENLGNQLAGTEDVVLEVSATGYPSLWAVPWELLRLNNRYLLRDNVTAIRAIEPTEAITFRAVPEDARPLRVAVVSGPGELVGRDETTDAGPDPTHDDLASALGEGSGIELLPRLIEPTAVELSMRLRDIGGVDLLIFRCHGDPGGLFLVKDKDRYGDSVLTPSAELVSAIAGGGVKAVVLLACRTSMGQFGTLATLLARAGVDTVAFQVSLPEGRARSFAEGIAGALRDGKSLPELAAAGRTATRNEGDWLEAVGACTLWQRPSGPLHLGRAPQVAPAQPSQPVVLLRTATGMVCTPIWDGRLELTPGRTSDPTVIASPDGRLIARRRGGATLDWAHVVRGSDAVFADAAATAELPDSGAGELLAISRSGWHDMLILWATGSRASVWRTDATGGFRELGGWDASALTGVLDGSRALTATVRDGRGQCQAFPALDVSSLNFATSGGRTVVLATGRDGTGSHGAWARWDGAEPVELAGTRLSLVLPSSDHLPPELWVDGELRVPEPARPDSADAFTGWRVMTR